MIMSVYFTAWCTVMMTLVVCVCSRWWDERVHGLQSDNQGEIYVKLYTFVSLTWRYWHSLKVCGEMIMGDV